MSDSANRRTRLPPRRRTPRRPTGKDYLSGLPLELFVPIVKYTIDNTSSKPLASLKSLSSCNKTIRAKCISSGLFQSLLVTLHRGPSTIRSIHQRLLLKTIPTFSIHSLTITEYIIGECPAELARLLQLLPQLRTLRIKGNRQTESSFSWDSLPPLKCGRLVSFNSLLYKTLSSKSRLRALECLEIIDCSITQVLIDVIAAIRSYTRLVWTRSHILHEPDLMQHTHCNVRTVQMSGTRFGNDRWMSRFLSYTRVSKSVEFLSLPETLVESIFAGLARNTLAMPKLEGYPKLMTVHVLPPSLPRNSYLLQRRGARHQIVLRTVVWRVPSFLRLDDALYYVPPHPLRTLILAIFLSGSIYFRVHITTRVRF